MSDGQDSGSELRREFRLDELDNGDRAVNFSANEAECDSLASRLEVAGISSLDAKLSIRRLEEGIYGVTGGFEAEVAVKIEGEEAALDFTVAEPVEETYVTTQGWKVLEVRTVDGEVDAELVDGSTIDLGELIAQSLSLALDPILLEAGALEEGVVAYSSGPEEGADNPHPFAALAALRGENFKE